MCKLAVILVPRTQSPSRVFGPESREIRDQNLTPCLLRLAEYHPDMARLGRAAQRQAEAAHLKGSSRKLVRWHFVELRLDRVQGLLQAWRAKYQRSPLSTVSIPHSVHDTNHATPICLSFGVQQRLGRSGRVQTLRGDRHLDRPSIRRCGSPGLR